MDIDPAALRALERDTLDVMSQHGSGGVIHLAAVPTFATRWLIPRLPELALAQPSSSMRVRNTSSNPPRARWTRTANRCDPPANSAPSSTTRRETSGVSPLPPLVR